MARQRKPFIVAMWAEDFDSVSDFDTEVEASMFAAGYQTGADKYGCGKCATYVLPGDRSIMEAEESAEDVAAVDAAITQVDDDDEQDGD